MTQVIDARVIEKDVRPLGGAARPTFQGNLLSAVVGGGHVVVVSQVKRVEAQIFWGALPWPSPRKVHFEEVQGSDPWQKWFSNLEGFRALKKGWNSYTAPAPDDTALRPARMFLAELREQGCEPTRVAPSAMGGIAITRRQGDRKGFVEFYNDGKVYALFSNRKGDMRVIPVQADSASFRRLILEMRDYLDG